MFPLFWCFVFRSPLKSIPYFEAQFLGERKKLIDSTSNFRSNSLDRSGNGFVTELLLKMTEQKSRNLSLKIWSINLSKIWPKKRVWSRLLKYLWRLSQTEIFQNFWRPILVKNMSFWKLNFDRSLWGHSIIT